MMSDRSVVGAMSRRISSGTRWLSSACVGNWLLAGGPEAAVPLRPPRPRGGELGGGGGGGACRRGEDDKGVSFSTSALLVRTVRGRAAGLRCVELDGAELVTAWWLDVARVGVFSITGTCGGVGVSGSRRGVLSARGKGVGVPGSASSTDRQCSCLMEVGARLPNSSS